MKFAIMATGSIAGQMAKTLTGMLQKADETGEKLQLEKYAVASRSLGKAQAFAEKWGFEKAYGSYEELAEDPEVDLVYVATPHSHHYECAFMCLEHGKSVLVEKAFTVNGTQARELIHRAREKNIFLAEAFWTRYMPARRLIDELLAQDMIGEITYVTADLGFRLEHVERMIEPSLAGGALLDLGVYPLNFALMFCKAPVNKVVSAAVMTDKGVDRTNSIILTFEDGIMAVLSSNMACNLRGEGVIFGKKGRIVVRGMHNIREITVYDNQGNILAQPEIPPQISGYEYEVLACMKALEEGRNECQEMPHSETLKLMDLLDEVRGQWNMKFPCESSR